MAVKEQEGGRRRALGRGLESLLPRAPKVVEAPAAEPVGEGGAKLTPAEVEALYSRVAARTPVKVSPEEVYYVKPLENHVLDVEIDLVDPNPYQTRTLLEDEGLEELAASIRQMGVLQPILVRERANGRYQLVAGQRRLRAAGLAAKRAIPAVVAVMSDEQAIEATIVENLQRADLTPMEQARAFERLGREFKMTQEQMAVRTGKDRATVTNFLRLLRLPEEVQEAMNKDQLSFGHARALLALETQEQMRRTAERVLAQGMSVRQTEAFVKGILNPERRVQVRRVMKDRVVDPNVREMETTLRESLGLRVEIEDHDGRGKLTIAYATLEEFDGLVERLRG